MAFFMTVLMKGCVSITLPSVETSFEKRETETSAVTAPVTEPVTYQQLTETTEPAETEPVLKVKGEYSSIIDHYDTSSNDNYLSHTKWTEDMVYSDIASLRQYLGKCISENHMTEICFIYSGSEKLETGLLSDHINVEVRSNIINKAELEYEGKSAVYASLEVKYFPSVNVADAYRKDDMSELTSDEVQLYLTASEFLKNNINSGMKETEKEWVIHEFICDSSYYYTDDTKTDEGSEIPRFRTAVGALVDGRANCMGYTDAFYMLCTMAGLEVTKVSGDEEMNHTWNVITLDGKKYMVDVTWNDGQKIDSPRAYYYYNAAADICSQEFHVDSERDRAVMSEIVPVPDEKYYYSNVPGRGYITYSSEEFYNKTVELLENGEKKFCICCQNNIVAGDTQEIFDNIKKRIKKRSYSISASYVNISGYSFVMVDTENDPRTVFS